MYAWMLKVYQKQTFSNAVYNSIGFLIEKSKVDSIEIYKQKYIWKSVDMQGSFKE